MKSINQSQGENKPLSLDKLPPMRKARAEAFFNHLLAIFSFNNIKSFPLSKSHYQKLSEFGFSKNDVEKAIDDLVKAGLIKITVEEGKVKSTERNTANFAYSIGKSLICVSIVETVKAEAA